MESNLEDRSSGVEYYRKLLECLHKALNDEELGCHLNDIIIQMSRCIESGYTYFNQGHSIWCDYFLTRGEKK